MSLEDHEDDKDDEEAEQQRNSEQLILICSVMTDIKYTIKIARRLSVLQAQSCIAAKMQRRTPKPYTIRRKAQAYFRLFIMSTWSAELPAIISITPRAYRKRLRLIYSTAMPALTKRIMVFTSGLGIISFL